MQSVAWQAVLRLAGALLLSLCLGLIFQHVVIALLIGVSIYLFIQLRNLILVERWLRYRSSQDPPDMGGPWGELIATAHRVYRRKQFYKQRVLILLREFRRLTSTMPDGAVLLGPNNEIIWFNRRAAQWLSLRRKRDFGARIENLVRNPEFSAYLAKGEAGSVTLRVQQGSAEECWLSISLVAGSDAQRKLLMVRDVSREARVESMRKDFVANASHELRSPLTVISGYLDSLADDPDLLPVWNEPVREMLRQAQRMRGIVEKLLELSRLEATTELLDQRPIDVGGLLALLRKDFLGEPVRPQTIALDSASHSFLYGAETEINSIFSNLISNAVKYTPTEGRVDIRWWSDAAGGHVSVKDTGIGIPAEHIPRLTERFYRADAGRSRTTGGSGLGLAIVKHALQRHGGSLTIESEEGVGSTFTCHFPLSRLVDQSDAA